MQEENKVMNDKGSLGPQAERKTPLSVTIGSIWEFWQTSEGLLAQQDSY